MDDSFWLLRVDDSLLSLSLSLDFRHHTNHALLRSIFPEDLVQYAGQHGLLQEILDPNVGQGPAMGATADYMQPF